MVLNFTREILTQSKKINRPATKGKANLEEIMPGSEWQEGPKELALDQKVWPASQDFKSKVPKVELRCRVYGTIYNQVEKG